MRVVHEEAGLGDAIRAGFARAGLTVDVSASAGESARAVVAKHEGDVVLWVGDTTKREEAWGAGVTEIVTSIDDVVTIGRLFLASKGNSRAILDGQFDDTLTVFQTIRALCATGRSGVLTLVRGFRRAEIRFYKGEVTSAQVGVMQGQSAFHQLLLWTNARFEWRRELVVRRAQIPLPHAEALAQAERFASEYTSASGGLSPSDVFEQDAGRVHALIGVLPTEVYSVLGLFDGRRTIADALEDSPFRMFETLRIVLRAIEVSLLTRSVAPFGSELSGRDQVERWLAADEAKVSSDPSIGKLRRAARAGNRSGDTDWAALIPSAGGLDRTSVTTVVPATTASGEVGGTGED